MPSTTISLIVIRSATLEASLAFYRALDIEFTEEQHGKGPIHYSSNFGGLVLEIYPLKAGASPEAVSSTTMLGFTVPSLERTLKDLSTLGIVPAKLPQQSEWGLWVNVLDPDGRTVQITEVAA